jgi:hypothetical protein
VSRRLQAQALDLQRRMREPTALQAADPVQ